jgi:pSer/pThr/pTyr-binding forkhead associated (FHA) protein
MDRSSELGAATQFSGSSDASALAGGSGVDCPQCARPNPEGNRFCASCGYKLNLAALPPKAAPAKAPGPAAVGDIRLTALSADGNEIGSFSVPDGSSIGRDTGSIFSGDNYLSPVHANFTRRGDRVLVNDAGSLNGVYLKLRANAPWALGLGDMFRIGQQILKLDALDGQNLTRDGVRQFGSPVRGYAARLSLMIGRETTGDALLIPMTGFHLGRERGDARFPNDAYVSSLHCQLSVDADNTIWLTDLGSSNGSFVRLTKEHPVSWGDILLMGQQLFRLDL